MKKEYMEPTIKVDEMKHCMLLTTSMPMYRGGSDPEIDDDDEFL